MKKALAAIYKYGYPLAKIYWFVRRPSAVGVRCIIRHEENILLVQHTYGSQLLTTVGGGLNKNESIIAGAKREAYEEVGLVLENVRVLDSILYTKEYKNDTVHICEATVSDTELTIDYAEIRQAAWHSKDNLPANTAPLLKHYL